MGSDPVQYKTQTRDSYDRLAPKVITGFDAYFEAHARLEADHFLNALTPNSEILDLGCGGGAASQYFLKHGHHVVSGDLSEVMLRECHHRQIPQLVRLDLEALPFHRNSFDAIWAHTSLIHIPKEHIPSVLDALVHLLKDNGVAFVALRGGREEGYLHRDSEPMWFSQFAEHEFRQYLPVAFELTREHFLQPNRGIFLNYHLRKRATISAHRVI